MINKAMAGMTGNYKQTSGTLKQITEEHNKIKSHIEEMEATYYEIEEELTKIQG